jgi:phospholipid/cholesterol/gamma-HCH transport system substrate-binding protein
MLKDDYTKTVFNLSYRPNPTSYYIFELIDTADYSRFDENKSVIKPTLHTEGKTLISLMMGKRYDNYLLRAGIKESSGGVGVDYITDGDVFQASLDMFDFNAVNDVRGDKPHATIEFRYRPINHLNFYTGADNFLNKDSINYFLGVGVNFVDDDLKYLMISGSSAIAGGK